MWRIELFLLVTALAVPLSAAAHGTGTPLRVYSCEINGRPVFGDTLPKECYGHAWVKRINGVVVHREAAQPTASESALRREQERQQEIAKKEAAKQRQQDQALLERYPTLADLDNRRDREMAEFDSVIAELRIDEQKLAERRKSLDDELKALKDKPASDDHAKAIAYADEELARARAAIEKKERERDSLRQRFDADRQHYLDISPRTRSR